MANDLSTPPPPCFDLTKEPWLPCVTAEGTVLELSLRDALIRAHEMRDLAVDAPNQYPPLIRLLLAVLHRALGAADDKSGVSWPRRKSEWRWLYDVGAFPAEAVHIYLDTWRDRFDLFHLERPFFQAADVLPPDSTKPGGKPEKSSKKSKKDEDAGKPSSLLVPHAASGNNAPIFSSARDADPAALTPAEAARWLVHVHAWDTAGIKTGAHNDPQAAKGKTMGNRIGLLGQQGVLIPTGRTLWQTLMFNLTVLNDDIAPPTDVPFWERAAALDSRWRSRLPDGVLDLYCWPSRRVLLLPTPDPDVGGNPPAVRKVLVCAGDRLLDESTLRGLEPHTAWHAVRPNGRPEAKDTEPALYQPIRHQPGRQLWRGLGAILGRRGESGDGGQGFERPRVLTHLQAMGRPIRTDIIQIRAFGTTYGIQNAVVDETYADTLPLPVAVLLPRGESGLDRVAVSSVEHSDSAARALGRYAADVAFCAGADDDAQKQRSDEARRRLYALLDQPFRTWVAGLTDEERMAEYRTAWHERVREAARRVAESIRVKAPPTALRTRMRPPQRGAKDGKPRPMNLAIAGLDFERALRRALPQAGWSGPDGAPPRADDDGKDGAP
jgi:CRISPR system Cascade subunit CasA